MDLIARLRNLLSRKFLAPIIGVASFIFWKTFLPMIPVEIFATFAGALFCGFIAVEGVKDIIIALKNSSPL